MPFLYASLAGSVLAATLGSNKIATSAAAEHLHGFMALPPNQIDQPPSFPLYLSAPRPPADRTAATARHTRSPVAANFPPLCPPCLLVSSARSHGGQGLVRAEACRHLPGWYNDGWSSRFTSGEMFPREPLPMEEISESNQQAGDSEAEKRPWQFSLWSLMVLTTLFAVLCSLLKSLGLLLFTLLFLAAFARLGYHPRRKTSKMTIHPITMRTTLL